MRFRYLGIGFMPTALPVTTTGYSASKADVRAHCRDVRPAESSEFLLQGSEWHRAPGIEARQAKPGLGDFLSRPTCGTRQRLVQSPAVRRVRARRASRC